jgi:hypothetical protein
MRYRYPWISKYGYSYCLFGWMYGSSHFLFGWMDLRFERDELFFCLVGWVRMTGLLWHVGSTFHWFIFDQNERFKWDESFFYLVGWARMTGWLWHVGSTFHWFIFNQNVIT